MEKKEQYIRISVDLSEKAYRNLESIASQRGARKEDIINGLLENITPLIPEGVTNWEHFLKTGQYEKKK